MAGLLVAGLWFSSCGNQADHAQHEDHANHEQETMAAEESSEVAEVSGSLDKAKVEAMLTAYLPLKDALVATNGADAKEAAEKLVSTLEGMEAPVVEAAQKIAESDDPEVQRAEFKVISEGLYAALKSSGGLETKVYQQYCPMAFKNTGAYWLSTSNEILNPYFGDKMLNCGSVKEEL
jgi:hypothetical protein